MTPRRELWLAVLLCLAGSGLALFAVTRDWVEIAVHESLTIRRVAEGSDGTRNAGIVKALAIVGLVGVPAIAATRRWGRVLLGLLLAGCGGIIAGRVGVMLTDFRREAGRCSDQAKCVAYDITASHPAWAVLTVIGGLLLLAGGLLVAVRGRRWAALSSSYEAPSAEPVELPATDKGTWDALDRGDDPTA